MTPNGTPRETYWNIKAVTETKNKISSRFRTLIRSVVAHNYRENHVQNRNRNLKFSRTLRLHRKISVKPRRMKLSNKKVVENGNLLQRMQYFSHKNIDIKIQHQSWSRA